MSEQLSAVDKLRAIKQYAGENGCEVPEDVFGFTSDELVERRLFPSLFFYPGFMEAVFGKEVQKWRSYLLYIPPGELIDRIYIWLSDKLNLASAIKIDDLSGYLFNNIIATFPHTRVIQLENLLRRHGWTVTKGYTEYLHPLVQEVVKISPDRDTFVRLIEEYYPTGIRIRGLGTVLFGDLKLVVTKFSVVREVIPPKVEKYESENKQTGERN